MIGRIAGRVVYRAVDHVMIDVGGVGYLVHCSDRTLAEIPQEGSETALFTDLLVKEDLLQLMGFASLAEKEWYRLLLGVQGVGAKVALAILGTLGADGTGQAIALGDAVAIKAAPGIGPKIAQRVVNELQGKAPAAPALAGASPAGAPRPDAEGAVSTETLAVTRPTGGAATAEALSALANLGYAPADAARAVAEVQRDTPDAETSALIREALRRLAPK